MRTPTTSPARRSQFTLYDLFRFVGSVAVVLAVAFGGLVDRLRQVINPVESWGIEVISVEKRAWPAPSDRQPTLDFTFVMRLAAEREFDFSVDHRRYEDANDGVPSVEPVGHVIQRWHEIGRCRSHRQYIGHPNVLAIRCVGSARQLIVSDVGGGNEQIARLSLQPPANAYSCTVTNPRGDGLIFSSGSGNRLFRIVWNIKDDEQAADVRIVDEFVFSAAFTD